MAVLFGVWRLTLNRLIAADMAAIRERSYPVTLADLNRWYPRVPPGENGAVVLGKAFANLSARSSPFHPWGDGPAARLPEGDSQANPQRQTVEGYLDGNSEAIALLHQASTVSRSRFPIDLSTLSIMPYPHLHNLVRSAYLLETEAANHTDCADPQLAVVSVQSLFALSHSLEKEPLVRSYLARLECQRIAIGSLQDLLGRTVLTDAHLDALGAALEKADDPRGLARAFIGQRCIGIHGFNMLQDALDVVALPTHSRSLGQRFLIGLNVLFSSPAYLYELCGLLQWDELDYLRFMDRYIQTAQTGFPERIDAAQELRRSLERQSELHALTRAWLRGMNGPRVVLKDAAMTARLRTARIAIAVERFRLAHGQFPDTLMELDPFGMRAVPTDPFDGRSLRYKRLSTGYIVYSVGEDGRDDGGDGTKDIAFLVER